MGGKVILFFLVAFCVAQEYQAASVQPYGVLEEFKEIVEKIKTAIKAMTGSLPKTIEEMKHKIEKLIENFNIMDLIKNIKDMMQDMLSRAGLDASAARECLDAEDSVLEKLNTDTTKAVQNCRDVAEQQINEVEQTRTKLHEDAQSLLKFCRDGNDACVKAHGVHIGEIMKCLVANVMPEAKEKVEKIMEETTKLIKEANMAAIEVPIKLTKCMATCSSNFIKGQEKVVKDFNGCISNLTKPTEKPTEPTTKLTPTTETSTLPTTELTSEA